MVVDTNIIIAFFNAEPVVVSALNEWLQTRNLLVSTVTVAELLALPKLEPKSAKIIIDFTENFLTIPVDKSLAVTAGYLRRAYSLHLPDALIAATAIKHNVPLVTRDKVFRKVSELDIIFI
jgi:predicted nucleic acid-binding protein